MFSGEITGYDAPSRIKRHTISGFPFPIINPLSKPNFGGFSLHWFPKRLTKSQRSKKDFFDDTQPEKNFFQKL